MVEMAGGFELKAERAYLAVCMFVVMFLALMSAAWTESPIVMTFLGYLPLLAMVALLHIASEQGLKTFVYWVIPFMIGFLFLLLGSLFNGFINYQLDVGALAVINIVFGLFIVLFLTLIEGRPLLPDAPEPVQEFNKDNLGEYLHSIEDKCKALNFVIGRVYRMSNGGTKELRARLRIDKEWYNEFNSLQDDDLVKRKKEALTILHKMHDRLLLLGKQEKDVLTEQEIKSLKHLARNKDGADRVIDVLVVNDRDPVEHYYVGAVEGVRRLLQEIEKL